MGWGWGGEGGEGCMRVVGVGAYDEMWMKRKVCMSSGGGGGYGSGGVGG